MAGSKVTVGNVEIVSLLDTPMEFPANAFFPSNDPGDFDPYRDHYPDAYGSGVNLRTYAHCFALRSEGKTILVDTGIGPGPVAMLGGISGHLAEDMNAKGVTPESVDVVVFTHLHPDHVGWNLTADNAPRFSKARYLAPQADWDFFTASDVASQNPHIGACVLPLKELGVLDLFSGEKALTDELTTYPTPGHTPGHTSIMVASAGEKAIITGDIAHHPAQADRTEWCAGFDGEPTQAVASRRKIFDQLEADGLMAAISHFPDPGFGKLVRLEGKRVWQAL
jgi:glyoxylase-like metal-dependent hydrolase (beta-lactamase superfamily II)